jgi:hypothetical protein
MFCFLGCDNPGKMWQNGWNPIDGWGRLGCENRDGLPVERLTFNEHKEKT